MSKLERVNKRMHFRRALDKVAKAFDELDKAMSALDNEDLGAMTSDVTLIEADFRVWSQTSVEALQSLARPSQ